MISCNGRPKRLPKNLALLWQRRRPSDGRSVLIQCINPLKASVTRQTIIDLKRRSRLSSFNLGLSLACEFAANGKLPPELQTQNSCRLPIDQPVCEPQRCKADRTRASLN